MVTARPAIHSLRRTCSYREHILLAVHVHRQQPHAVLERRGRPVLRGGSDEVGLVHTRIPAQLTTTPMCLHTATLNTHVMQSLALPGPSVWMYVYIFVVKMQVDGRADVCIGVHIDALADIARVGCTHQLLDAVAGRINVQQRRCVWWAVLLRGGLEVGRLDEEAAAGGVQGRPLHVTLAAMLGGLDVGDVLLVHCAPIHTLECARFSVAVVLVRPSAFPHELAECGRHHHVQTHTWQGRHDGGRLGCHAHTASEMHRTSGEDRVVVVHLEVRIDCVVGCDGLGEGHLGDSHAAARYRILQCADVRIKVHDWLVQLEQFGLLPTRRVADALTTWRFVCGDSQYVAQSPRQHLAGNVEGTASSRSPAIVVSRGPHEAHRRAMTIPNVLNRKLPGRLPREVTPLLV
mmetsp:Transcript_6738/g.19608  ORF Transcript_6738/g.19608 Transcript_6738/m.19608 type:complete len:404 (+) Transcript_6738:100-1311(+)